MYVYHNRQPFNCNQSYIQYVAFYQDAFTGKVQYTPLNDIISANYHSTGKHLLTA
jgi:hypothetical protein